jgi:hypothetical protein
MDRQKFNRSEIKNIADDNGLGGVHFQYNIAQNTGREFEVGYVYVNGVKQLFCKRGHNTDDTMFYLCNEFEALIK